MKNQIYWFYKQHYLYFGIQVLVQRSSNCDSIRPFQTIGKLLDTLEDDGLKPNSPNNSCWRIIWIIQIEPGVHHGCTLSPLLFHSNKIIQNELYICEEVLTAVYGIQIVILWYDDDTFIISNTMEDLQELLNQVSTESSEFEC